MEILSTTEHYFIFYLALSVVGVVTMICLTLGIFSTFLMIKDSDYQVSNIIFTILLLACGSYFTYGITQGVKVGVEITHKAKVTDFNEVYNNGYEVKGRDGDLYIITKTR